MKYEKSMAKLHVVIKRKGFHLREMKMKHWKKSQTDKSLQRFDKMPDS